MNGTDRPRLSRGARLKFDEIRSSTLLLLPECTVKLNKTAATIIELVDGERRVDDIVRELAGRFKEDGIRPDVLEFLNDARERGWIVIDEDASA